MASGKAASRLAPDLLDDLRTRLRDELAFDLAETAEIDPGVVHNNRLLRLRAADGRQLVAKIYYRDDRRRLDREFGAIAFLCARGFRTVPTPYFRSDTHQYAVYSFEPGVTKPSSQLTPDLLTALGRFAADLHRISPDDPDARAANFPTAVSATFSFADQIAGIRRRLAAFCDFASSPDAYPAVRALTQEGDARTAVERLIAAATAGLSDGAIAARLPEHTWRLTTSDFVPHNVIVRAPGPSGPSGPSGPAGHPDGPICVVDLEYFGWDDPAALIASFLTADTALDLSAAQAETFVRAYRSAFPPGQDPAQTATPRFARMAALMHVSWSAVHLSVMTPERVANKRFASSAFDLDAHLAQQTAKFRHRLLRAEQAIAALP